MLCSDRFVEQQTLERSHSALRNTKWRRARLPNRGDCSLCIEINSNDIAIKWLAPTLPRPFHALATGPRRRRG
jgi:hypothetical protein